jgi:hypothetical protein
MAHLQAPNHLHASGQKALLPIDACAQQNQLRSLRKDKVKAGPGIPGPAFYYPRFIESDVLVIAV